MMKTNRLLAAVLLLLIQYTTALAQKQDTIHPGELWPDADGNHIQAHGGGIIKIGKSYYWYGEERRKGVELDTVYRYVSCYKSDDLMNWKFMGDAIKLAKPDITIQGTQFILERPKVYYNKTSKTYVMYMHLDGPTRGHKGYAFASVGVAISNKPEGPFKFVHAFRPLGKESRDIGQFIDDDGSAYLVFESRPSGGFYIAKLSNDYLTVAEETSFIHAPMEGGAIVHYQGFYYVIGSSLTGWNPNPNKVSTSPSISGPWTPLRRYCTTGNQDLPFAIDHVVKSSRQKRYNRYFYGRPMAPQNAMGFALPVGACTNREWQTMGT